MTALPKDDPVITGVAAQYQIGDEINLNCTSAKSFPPSTLHWYINEQQVNKEFFYFLFFIFSLQSVILIKKD